jgi:hypothetical protein
MLENVAAHAVDRREDSKAACDHHPQLELEP